MSLPFTLASLPCNAFLFLVALYIFLHFYIHPLRLSPPILDTLHHHIAAPESDCQHTTVAFVNRLDYGGYTAISDYTT
jgi:hypothetical protein